MGNNSIWAIVPCKNTMTSKSRLAPVLTPAERCKLTYAMLNDVLAALSKVNALSVILVASSDVIAQETALKYGARIYTKDCDHGLLPAFVAASSFAKEQGADSIVTVASDLPLLEPSDISRTLKALQQNRSVVLAPAGKDQGTNVLAMSPPGIITYAYGENSFSVHLSIARAFGIEPQIIRTNRLSLDIDTPEDLLTFAARPSDTHAYRYLKDSGIANRLFSSDETNSSSVKSARGRNLWV